MYSRIHLSSFFQLAILFGLCGCLGNDRFAKATADKTDFIITEKDLIPEGLSVDPISNSIFLSSTYKRKIIRIDSTGWVTDFIKTGQDGIWSVLGMEVDSKRRHIWVASSQAAEVLPLLDPDSLQWRSAIYQYNLDNGQFIRSWRLPTQNVFFNDLTLASNGDVYVTETMQNGIYRLPAGADSIELFLKPHPYTFLNGICFSDLPNQLFVSATEGVIKVNTEARGYALLKTDKAIDAAEVDGLSFYKDGFIAHQSTRLTRFQLNQTRDTITSLAVLDSGPEFDGTTTGERVLNQYYFIVNSQIQSGIDFKQRIIKPVDSLNNIIIRKIRL